MDFFYVGLSNTHYDLRELPFLKEILRLSCRYINKNNNQYKNY